MSGLCLTPSGLATINIALNHFFYPQSYPQRERRWIASKFTAPRVFRAHSLRNMRRNAFACGEQCALIVLSEVANSV
jgi:hypothetical protein